MVAKQWDDTNRGFLVNRIAEKRPDKQDPDYTGKVNINGVEGQLAGWINVSKKGEKYLSLKVTPVESRRVAGNGAAADDVDGLAF